MIEENLIKRVENSKIMLFNKNSYHLNFRQVIKSNNL